MMVSTGRFGVCTVHPIKMIIGMKQKVINRVTVLQYFLLSKLSGPIQACVKNDASLSRSENTFHHDSDVSDAAAMGLTLVR